MRKKITLIAAFALLAMASLDFAYAQGPIVLEISSRLPSSPLAIEIDNPNLQPTQIATPVTVTTTTTGGFPGISYQWVPTTGLSDPTLESPILTFDTTVTSYTVTATDANGCISTDVLTIDFSVSAVDRRLLPVNLSIFPNPSDGVFHMSLKGRPLGDDLEIRVLDMVGRELYSEGGIRFTGELEKDLDLQALGAGIYFVSLRAGNAQTAQKLVIK